MGKGAILTVAAIFSPKPHASLVLPLVCGAVILATRITRTSLSLLGTALAFLFLALSFGALILTFTSFVLALSLGCYGGIIILSQVPRHLIGRQLPQLRLYCIKKHNHAMGPAKLDIGKDSDKRHASSQAVILLLQSFNHRLDSLICSYAGVSGNDNDATLLFASLHLLSMSMASRAVAAGTNIPKKLDQRLLLLKATWTNTQVQFFQ